MTIGKPQSDVEKLANAYHIEEPDALYRSQIQDLLTRSRDGDDKAELELKDRLMGHLAFGTAGLRAKMEAGYRRLNAVSVSKAAYALGQVLLEDHKKSVVVGFDARNHSQDLAEEAIAVLTGLGLKVHAFAEKVATPICAFSVNQLSADAALMVTASHNPPDDNGIKVYWSRGEQIVSPIDSFIEEEMRRAPPRNQMSRLSVDEQEAQGLRQTIGPQLFDAYFAQVSRFKLHSMSNGGSVKIVYTPLHGVGNKFASRALRDAGFTNFHAVKSQAEPDGNFPTVKFPNPEEAGALDEAIELAEDSSADLILANDPDADRLAVVIKNPKNGKWTPLSGNEIGVLLGADAIAHAHTENRKKLVVSTLVSSRMLSRVAARENASYVETLTGFSRIANIAITRERDLGEQFIFGYEEALGYCVGNFVRDKDGIGAAVRFAELFAHLKQQGKSVFAELDRLAILYGVFRGLQWSLRYDGPMAGDHMASVMAKLRNHKDLIYQLDGVALSDRLDLLQPRGNEPPANVLVYHAGDATRLIVRPSGTEPKIKFYLETVGEAKSQSELPQIRVKLDTSLQKIREELSLLLDF